MVNAQEWLDKNYSKEVKELDLANQDLVGQLIIQDFPDLESIKCGNNKNLASIKLINLPKLNYFHANGCQVAYLTIDNCPEINELNIANNLLTNTSFLSSLNPEKLTHLSIHSNNFAEQDLSFLSKFVKLEKLFVDNHSKEKLEQNIYNRFCGSLQPLQNLRELKWINIANTDIDSGLEYLPPSLRKICLINSWQQKNAGYLKIKWEIERSVRFPGVTEKLQQQEENEPPFVKDWYRFAPWHQVKNLLGIEVFKKQEAQEWLNEKYPPYTNRQHYKEIIMSDKNLVGKLDLSDFTNLEKLNCSYNQLTDLNLSGCQNLVELDCSNNEFTNTNFLQTIPNQEKLEKLKLNDNQELKESLNFLTPFTALKVLNIGNCPFTGSLKYLENMKELRIIILTNTDVDSGLDYLSDNCRELYCEPDTTKKSAKIASILVKHLEERRDGEKYFNLVKWREELRSNIVLSIPIERLFVIRSNIKKFVNKWGEEVEDDWYEKNKKKFFGSGKTNELSNLQSPKEFKINWYWTIPQWGGRAAIGISGILSFYDYQVGAVAVASPIIETVTSYAKQKWYEEKSQKWEEFTKDAVELLDNYHELKGILESLRGYKIGKEKLDEVLKDLDNRSKEFSVKYDEDSNGTVSVFELQIKKNKLAQDLDREKIEEGSSQLGGIFQAIKELEKEINKYRRSFYYGTVEEEEKKEIQQEATRVEIPSEFVQDDSHIRLLDTLENENIELETRIEALPKK